MKDISRPYFSVLDKVWTASDRKLAYGPGLQYCKALES